MPCMDYDDRPGFQVPNTTNYKEEVDRLKARNDELAQMLCHTLGVLDREKFNMSPLSTETLRWWSDHKLKDAKRRRSEKEKFRKNILRLISDGKIDRADIQSVMEDLLNEQ